MPQQPPKITFHLTETMLRKIKFIAVAHCRSISGEMRMLIRKHVDEFEETNCPIEEDSQEDDSKNT